MSCPLSSCKKTLSYVSPAHGGWGVVRVAALVPESHQLFVCPFACGRHGALGATIHGIKERISYLYIDEADIVSGQYEHLIPDAVEELFDALQKRPRVLMVFVSCLDDLLGTDHEELTRNLHEAHPDVSFVSCHMNPMSLDTSNPPPVSLQRNIYRLLEPTQEKKRQINLIGNHVALHPGTDLELLLKNKGYTLCHISQMSTFDEFQHMSQSILNLVLSPVAKKAAEDMKRRLGIPYLLAYPSYDLDEVDRFYQSLGEMLGETFDCSSYRRQAEEAIEVARKKVGKHPIAVDSQAVRKPFGLAAALRRYGFYVSLVFVDELHAFDREGYDALLQTNDVEVVNASHHNMVEGLAGKGEPLAIGFDVAYATKTPYAVNLIADEGLFGYDGICRFMDSLVQGVQTPVDLRHWIEEAGLVV